MYRKIERDNISGKYFCVQFGSSTDGQSPGFFINIPQEVDGSEASLQQYAVAKLKKENKKQQNGELSCCYRTHVFQPFLNPVS